MTWGMVAIMVGVCSASAFGLGLWFGTNTSNAHLERDAFLNGRNEGLETAYHTAKAALDAPSEGTSRSIVGRAIVRKLRALADGTGE